MDGAFLYILRCADGKLYTGLTRRAVDERVSEHQQGLSAFTKRRLPVHLMFSEHYPSIMDARGNHLRGRSVVLPEARDVTGWPMTA